MVAVFEPASIQGLCAAHVLNIPVTASVTLKYARPNWREAFFIGPPRVANHVATNQREGFARLNRGKCLQTFQLGRLARCGAK